MVSSGTGLFGEEKFDQFNNWFSSLPQSMYPKDFLYWDGKGLCWLYLYDEKMNVPSAFEIVDFEGGLYSVATDIDQKTNMNAMKTAVDQFLDENGFTRDDSRFELGNIITSPKAKEILGCCQMDYYTPVKPKA
ncbi:MAG: AraC family transcriptional regulator [Clostridiaceae bacterium]|nr:AraC family transcriptional regulator [Clostridiaceae bacterium]